MVIIKQLELNLFNKNFMRMISCLIQC